jgi:glycosyltransferase involved in cell wall biosynthesis
VVSVVVPVYRNASTLAALCARLAAVLPAEHEILLVDDGCPAGSGAVIHALAGDRVRGLRHDVNRGQNAAVLTGLAAATGDQIVVLDADLQDPPEAVPRLLAELRSGSAAAVFGGRRGAYEPPLRLAGSRVFKRLLWLASGRRVPADAGLFLAMDGRMRERVLAAAGPETYVIAAMGRSGLPMRSVPVARERAAASGYRGRDRVRLAARALGQAVGR